MKEQRLMKVILSPHMSEKAAMGTEKNRSYVFQVCLDTNKTEVKQAIEYLFNTKVDQVRIVNVKTKERRFGNVLGKKKGWKKAYITLSEGQRIDMAGSAKA
jgi:large subunit ribosomal protein L23